MLDQLALKAEYAKLEAIQSGRVKILEVFTAWQNQALNTIDLTDTNKPFPLYLRLVDHLHQGGQRRKANIKSAFKQLEKRARKGATIKDLPDLLKRYKVICTKAGKYRASGIAKNSCRAFLKDTFDKKHDQYRQIDAISGLDETPQRKKPTLPRRTCSLSQEASG